MVVAAVAVPDVASVPGLDKLTYNKLAVAQLEAEQEKLLSEIRPTISMFWVGEANQKIDYAKSFIAVGEETRCTLTLGRRPRPKAGWPADTTAKLGELGIPMVATKAFHTINPVYHADPVVMGKLSRLLAAIPDNGLPPDMFIRVPSQMTIPDDTILRVLRHKSAKEAVAVLPLVASISIGKIEVIAKNGLKNFFKRLPAIMNGTPKSADVVAIGTGKAIAA